MSAEEIEYVVRVNEDADGSLWAEVVDLPGCFASGDNLDELREALEEAILLYLADDRAASEIGKAGGLGVGERHPMRVGEIRVKVQA